MSLARYDNSQPRAPALPAGFLPRPRLAEALLHAEGRLRLVCAPAGSGKSMLLRECAQHCPDETRLHWLDLKGLPLSELELVRLLAAMLGLEHADPGALQLHLMQQRNPIWLMLDDLPRRPDEAFDNLLNHLVQSASANVHWWIASRRRPRLQLERLLLEGELFEIGANELNLTADELGELLASQGHAPAPELLAGLLEQTGGWYAGVRLRLHGAEHGNPFEHGRGTPLLQNYLERELLGELPEQWLRALGTLACVERFDAALCEHLLGVGEGAALLRQLQECGVFIEEVLELGARLFRVQPAVARVVAASVAEGSKKALYRKACQWFIQRGQLRQGIEYALLAEQPEVAASLLHRFTDDRILQGRNVERMLRWHDQLPPDLRSGTPRLLMLFAWALLIGGRLDEAEHCAAQLQRFLPQPNQKRQRELLAHWQAIAGKIAYHRGQGDTPHLEESLAHLPEAAWAPRLVLLSALIDLRLFSGDDEAAQQLNREAVRLARRHGSLAMEGVLILQYVQLLGIRGELKRAESQLARLLGELDGQWDGEPNPLRGRALLLRGQALAHLGQHAEAARLYEAGLQQCLDSADPAACWGYLGLAMLDAADNDLTRAFARLADAERMLQYRQVTEPLYQSLLVLAYGQLWLQQGRHGRAQQALQQCLQAFRSVQGYKPPYGNPELLQRLELLHAQARLASGEAVAPQLEAMLQQAQAKNHRVLACELLFALAEAHYQAGQTGKAQAVLLEGLTLARQIGMASIERLYGMRNPGLLRWGHEALCENGTAGQAALLSRRELAVLQMIAQGLSNHEIAERLFISLHTVKSHAQRINIKLGVSRRTQAIVRAKELGLVK
ncbi:ATP/maltotriose-dependent transcriptional regulator MalT [Pseudomonas citronellolis]|nr:LuxR C-terminal-related transcriptional regulator [Pseudomonas citronellolis]MCP1644878.1 ATP/maltotriose-dependent transcriptional regulator MalT [Pseudomonas citronellolis]MCP1667823.1 ATP/maltotriose-dependent transcriptional regulator MalT [Pseudomonas citronellolis]MCP1699081.1 ATP/maltotriose-dependent transcriptional regulator MalT [Pseudomonas citronellolis]MCP1704930.1 ATP/maltotriose-dependent transcriptional regulator MalT [Pseudomonas citronellolis]MCP1799644.1 ATP/maltotriose-d